jgi:hypothetical protein
MLSQNAVSRIRAEIETLELARRSCHDSGIQKQIDFWIQELKKKLEDRDPALPGKAMGA